MILNDFRMFNLIKYEGLESDDSKHSKFLIQVLSYYYLQFVKNVFFKLICLIIFYNKVYEILSSWNKYDLE